MPFDSRKYSARATGIFQRPKGVVEQGRHVQSLLAFRCAGAAEAIGMPLAAAFVEALFEVVGIERKLGLKSQGFVILHRGL